MKTTEECKTTGECNRLVETRAVLWLSAACSSSASVWYADSFDRKAEARRVDMVSGALLLWP